MASNVVAGAVCCCSVPCPKTRVEKRVLLVGGVLNILVPCGLGSIIAGCWLRDNQLISTGVLQLILTLLIVGIIWSIVYGGLMLLSAFTVTISSPSSQPPLSSVLTPSGHMPSSSLQYQYHEPQKSPYHSHAYTSLPHARAAEKGLVLAMQETKPFSPTARPPAMLHSGTSDAEVYTKEEECSAEATLVTQPQVGAMLYHETSCG